MLDAQKGAKVTHEAAPLMPWLKDEALHHERMILYVNHRFEAPMTPYRVKALRFAERLKKFKMVGDVASFWLPYLPELREDFGGLLKVIGLIRRDKDAFIRSFIRKTGGEAGPHHWTEHDGTKWERNCWSMVHPSYGRNLPKREALSRYYDEYNETLMRLKGEPWFHLEAMEAMSTRAAQDEIAAFLGVDDWIYEDGVYNRSGDPNQLLDANPVREDARGEGVTLTADGRRAE